MPTPCPRSRRKAPNSRATSSAGRLAVGSSSTRISASAASARAIATIDFSVRVKFWIRRSGWMSAPSLASAVRARVRAAVQIDHAEAARIPQCQADILGDGHPFDQAEILMNERNGHSPNRMCMALSVVGNTALVERVNAGEDLDERRLAGTVLAQQRQNLASADRLTSLSAWVPPKRLDTLRTSSKVRPRPVGSRSGCHRIRPPFVFIVMARMD